MGRKKRKDTDAAADFFGDSDLDWLDDEGEEGGRDRLPVAPPPPPPVARTARPLDAAAADWANKVTEAPKDPKALSSAPTLIFSTVPTLPPIESAVADAPQPGAPPPSDRGTTTEDIPTVEVAKPPTPPPEPGPRPPVKDDLENLPTESIVAPSSDAERIVPARLREAEVPRASDPGTQPTEHMEPPPEPGPARLSVSLGATPGPTVKRAPREAAVPTSSAPAAGVRPPPEGLDAWRDAEQTLQAEAAHAAGNGRTALLAEAARISYWVLGDAEAAAETLDRATREGDLDPEALRLLAEAHGVWGRFEDQERTLAALAQKAEAVDAGEASLEAALVAWRRLERPDAAVAHLRRTAKLLPDDYTSRALLRALLPQVDPDNADERLVFLDVLARLAEGGIAADAWVELATVAEEHGITDRIRPALEAALEAEPGHTAAFQRLERELASDPASLAAMYEVEALRDGQPDVGWWKVQAARAWQRAGRGGAAVEAFTTAVDQGYGFALRELQGGYVRAGAPRELEAVLAHEAKATAIADGRAFALYRLGWLREHLLGDRAGALGAYREAVEVDPGAGPAADGVARLLDTREERRALWTDRLERSPDPDDRRALRIRLAEMAEADGDDAQAREMFSAALEAGAGGPEAEIARDGLDRVLQRLGDAPALVELRRRRAESTWDASEKIGWLLVAASGPATDAALPVLLEALDARPDHPVALAAAMLPLERAGLWGDLAERLRAAGQQAEDPDRRAAWLYRAARILSERTGEDAAALVCVEQALAADPRLRPARWLSRTLRAGRDPALEAATYRDLARHLVDPAARTWALFAAAVATGQGPEAKADLAGLLEQEPGHPGAIAALEVLLVAEGDRPALVRLYRMAMDRVTGAAGARLAARAAELLADAGHVDEAALVLRRLQGVAGAPLRAAARLALSIGAADRAIELLAGADTGEDRVEHARLLAAVGRSDEALPVLMGLLEKNADRVGVAARAATVAQIVGDTDAMIRAYATIAEHARSPSLRAAYGAWTAMQLQAGGHDDQALQHWRIALAERPGSSTALAGATRGLVARGDADGLRKLYGMLRPESPMLLAQALVQVDDRAGAADLLASYAEGMRDGGAPAEAQVAALLWVERLRGDLGGWQEAYDALAQRRELCRAPVVRSAADATRRWILSEKLVDTDAAWDLYRRLHDDAPADRQVTEALARIAGARGEVSLAIAFLQELADGAVDPSEAARYRRRIGEVYERSEQVDGARQAYLDALDHLPEDPAALEGLRRLAAQAKDWTGLVAVLQREAGSSDRDRQLEVRREIARVDEERIGDRAVAMDAWRGVLEIAPGDREALEHLLRLSEGLEEWGTFVEIGEALSEQLEGSAKAELLRRVGVACADQLGRDPLRYYEAAVAGPTPDFEAAQRLEQLSRARADWAGTVRALALQADAATDPARRVEVLLKAARIESEALHDKDAAAGLYRRILDLRPEHEVALRFMVAHLFESQRYDEALPLCVRLEPVVEKGQDLDDFDTRMELSSFYFSFAEMLRASEDEERALPRYERTLDLNPTHLPSLEAVGPLYTAQRDWQKAERVYRQLLQLSGGQGDRPKVAGTYTALGLVERELGLQDKAYKRFTKALELHPNHVGALKGMALVLEDRQDWSNLLNVYNNIIYHATIPEDVIDAYMTKGRILDDHMERQDKAAQHYQRSLDFDPNQPVAYLRLAELALRRDAHKEAGDFVDKALALDQDLVAQVRGLLLLVKAASHQHAGHVTEAERCVREAKILESTAVGKLGDSPLQNLETLRQTVRERLPKA